MSDGKQRMWRKLFKQPVRFFALCLLMNAVAIGFVVSNSSPDNVTEFQVNILGLAVCGFLISALSMLVCYIFKR